MSPYIPGVLWTIISARGLWTWRRNARRMGESLEALRSNGNTALEVLFAKTDQLMDNMRALAFLNGLVVGVLSLFVTHGFAFTKDPTFLRVYSDYTLTVLIGAFFIFMLNGEIYSYVLDKVHGRR